MRTTVLRCLRPIVGALLVVLGGVGCNSEVSLSSLEVTSASAQMGKGATMQLRATAHYSDSTARDVTALATWTSGNEDIAMVYDDATSKGLAHGMSQGTAEIKATFIDGGKTQVGAFTITVGDAVMQRLVITPANRSIAARTSMQIHAIAIMSDNGFSDVTGQVGWSVEGTAATISNDAATRGWLTAVAPGKVTVKAALGALGDSTVFTVTDATLQRIELTPSSFGIAKGTSARLHATGVFSDSTVQDVTLLAEWASSAPCVTTSNATLEARGQVNGVTEGQATITATFLNVSGMTDVTVSQAVLASIGVTPAAPMLAAGTSIEMHATGVFTDGTAQDLTEQVTWAADDPTIVAVSNDKELQGHARALKKGTTRVTATLAGAVGSTPFTVSAAQLVRLQIQPSHLVLAKGTGRRMMAIGVFTDGTMQDVSRIATWYTSNRDVVDVSNVMNMNGYVDARDVGTANITAVVGAVQDITEVVVTAATVTRIDVSPALVGMARGTRLHLYATGVLTDGTTQDLTQLATWTSSAPGVVAVSNSDGWGGILSAVGLGTADITAVFGGKTGIAHVTVVMSALVEIAVSPVGQWIPKGTGIQFHAVGRFADDTTLDLTDQVTWGSSDPSVAISNESDTRGWAVGVDEGKSNITASLAGKNALTTLEVRPAVLTAIAVTPRDASTPKGTSKQFSATGTYSDGTTFDLTPFVAWDSSNHDVATIASGHFYQLVLGIVPGAAFGAGVGQATITASYGGMSGSATLMVSPAALRTVTLTPQNPTVSKGTTLWLQLIASFSDGTQIDVSQPATWTSADPTIALVSNAWESSGLVTGVAPGSVVIMAEYRDQRATTTVTVTAATLSSIVVTPGHASIAGGLTQQFTATGTFSDQHTQDMTSIVTWTSSEPSVAIISNIWRSRGLASAVHTGTTTISATHAGLIGTATLDVK